MKTLTGTLETAQKAGSQPIWKVVFTKASQTTRGYSQWTANAVLEARGEEEDLSSTATIVIDNSDESLTSLGLRGYQAVISFGYVTTVSETAWQASTAYSVNDIVVPATSNGYKYICTTAGTSGGSAPNWGTSLGGTTADGAGALVWTLYGKTGEEYRDRVPLTVRKQWVQNVPTGATLLIEAQGTANGLKDDQASARYTILSTDTQTVKTHIAAVLGATRAAYNHTTAYTLVWDSEDSLVDSYKPTSGYTIGFRETREANLRKLLDYVRMTVRVENDGKYHFAEPRNAKASTWAADTAYALRATVKPTTANNHIYVCTTAGTSGGSEPNWPTTIDATVADGAGALVWTLTYDYQYDSADGNHIFYAAAEGTATVIPNKITVQSDPDTGDGYTGTATDTENNDLEPRQEFLNLKLASNAQALSIANALLVQAQMRASQGSLVTNINCGQEVHDLIRVHDAQLDKYYIGNVGKITFNASKDSFTMQLQMGKQAGTGVGLPSMGMSGQQWQLNLKNIADIVYAYTYRLDQLYTSVIRLEDVVMDLLSSVIYLDTRITVESLDVGAKVYHSANQSISNNTWTTLSFDSEEYDNDVIHDNSTNNSRLTCKTAGKYLVIFQGEFAVNATGIRAVTIRLNGGAVNVGKNTVPGDSEHGTGLSCAVIADLAVNDYLEVRVLQNSGGALNFTIQTDFSPRFMMQRIASDKVA